MHILVLEDVQFLQEQNNALKFLLKALLDDAKCQLFVETENVWPLIGKGGAFLLIQAVDQLLAEAFWLCEVDLLAEILSIVQDLDDHRNVAHVALPDGDSNRSL